MKDFLNNLKFQVERSMNPTSLELETLLNKFNIAYTSQAAEGKEISNFPFIDLDLIPSYKAFKIFQTQNGRQAKTFAYDQVNQETYRIDNIQFYSNPNSPMYSINGIGNPLLFLFNYNKSTHRYFKDLANRDEQNSMPDNSRNYDSRSLDTDMSLATLPNKYTLRTCFPIISQKRYIDMRYTDPFKDVKNRPSIFISEGNPPIENITKVVYLI